MEAKHNILRLALLAALVIATAGITFSKIRGQHFNSPDPGETIPVLVADRYIPAFTVIKPEMVRGQIFPKECAPPGALMTKMELANEANQSLFVSAIAIPEGQPVTRALVTDASQNDTLGALVSHGKVAVSFEIDKAHGVGGWIRPGDTVAVFESATKKTRLLFPSVIVAAVDDRRIGQSEKKTDGALDAAGVPDVAALAGARVLTVLVSPLEASTIIQAREEGNLSVVLRSLGDDIPWPKVD